MSDGKRLVGDGAGRSILTRRELVAMSVMVAAVGNEALMREFGRKGVPVGRWAAEQTNVMLDCLYDETVEVRRKEVRV